MIPLFLIFMGFFLSASQLASFETQFRSVQAVYPKGARRNEGLAFLPVLITKRQRALRQINGKGSGANAGHVQ